MKRKGLSDELIFFMKDWSIGVLIYEFLAVRIRSLWMASIYWYADYFFLDSSTFVEFIFSLS